MSAPKTLASALPLVLTLWPSRSNPFGRRQSLTLARFIERYIADPEPSDRKETVAGYSLAIFGGDRRALENVEEAYALTLDFDDGGTSIEQAACLFPRTRGVVYTSYSNTPGKPKLRLVLLLRRPVTAEEYRRLWFWAEARCTRRKHRIDPSAKDASRFWYLPSRPPDCTTYEWRELPGRCLDVDVLLRAHPAPRPLPAGRQTTARRGRPGSQEVGGKAGGPAANTTFFGRACELSDLDARLRRNGRLTIKCPWASEHTGGFHGDTSTVILPGTSEWGLFKCSHGHCAKRETLDLLEVLPPEALAAARAEHGAGLVRARIVRGNVEHFDAHDGRPALDRLALWCAPIGYVARGGFRLTVKLGSEAHRGLDSLALERLIGRRVDVAMRGSEITWTRLVPEALTKKTKKKERRASTTSETARARRSA